MIGIGGLNLVQNGVLNGGLGQDNNTNNNTNDPRGEPGFILDKSYSSQADFIESNRIREIIAKYFDHPEKDRLKESIIMRIQDVVNRWMRNINVNERKIPEEVAHMQLARVLPFGSYFLGVSSVDGDVDLVCIAPNFVERQRHFNGQLFEMLSQMEGVTYENNVMDAKVPILQFEIKGVPIDISFAQLDVETLPDDLDREIPDKHLRNMEDREKMSINGYRCNQLILKHVMESSQNAIWSKKRFQDALKVIKIWARNNGIYDNRLGFLGGISWALLLAKLVQLFPNVELNRLLEEFFFQFSTWNWSIMEISLALLSPEKTIKPGKAEMCIYTPAIPEYNSTERVKRINMGVIIRKIQEGNRIVQDIKRGVSGWERLLKQEDFLKEYSRFIEIDLIRTELDHSKREFQTQQDKLSVKLLTLFDILSQSKPTGLEIRPWPTFYQKQDPNYPQCQAFLIGVKAREQMQDVFSFKNAIVDFANQQQKSLESLTNCMIRVFQATREDLTDIIFVESQQEQKDTNDSNNKQKLSNSINQKRINPSTSDPPLIGSDPSKKIKQNEINQYLQEEEAKNSQLLAALTLPPREHIESINSPSHTEEGDRLEDYY